MFELSGRRLKELLRAKLVECGWKDQLKAHCKGEWIYMPVYLSLNFALKCFWGFFCFVFYYSSYYLFLMFCSEVIKEKGLEHVTVEDLVTEVTPKGRGTDFLFYNTRMEEYKYK